MGSTKYGPEILTHPLEKTSKGGSLQGSSSSRPVGSRHGRSCLLNQQTTSSSPPTRGWRAGRVDGRATPWKPWGPETIGTGLFLIDLAQLALHTDIFDKK